MAADRRAFVLKFDADLGAGDQTFYFSTLPVDDSSGLTIEPRVANEPIFRKGFGLWIWNSRSESSVSDVDLSNADGRLDDLARAVVRDKPAEIYVGDPEADFSTFDLVSSLVLDRIISTSRRRIRLVFVELASLLETTLQSEYWTDAVPNVNIEGQSVPYAFGLVYQAPAQVYDGTNLLYAITHEQGGPADFLDVSSNGAPALSSQFQAAEYGFEFLITPAGKVTSSFYAVQKSTGLTTADVSPNYPNSDQINAGENENLDAYTGSPGKPTGYTITNDNETSPIRILEQFNASSTKVQNNGTGTLYDLDRAPSIGRDVGLVRDRWYLLRVNFIQGSGLSNFLNSVRLATCDAVDLGKSAGFSATVGDSYSILETITFEGTVAAGSGTDLLFYFQATGPAFELFFSGRERSGGTQTQVRLNNLRIWEIESPTTEQIETAVPYILARVPSVGFSSADLSALNTEIGSHEIGYFYQRPTTVENALLDVLDPFLGFYYFDELGDARFGRLKAPDETNVQIETLFGSGSWTVPEYVTEIDVLVVGGGGGGGVYITGVEQGGGGGGGAGELIFLGRVSADQISDGAGFGDSIAYSVGGGGSGGLVSAGNQGGAPGGDTTFGDLTARGGGAGEGCDPDTAKPQYLPANLDGGSGGGSAADNFATGSRRPAGASTASDGVGFPGGQGETGTSSQAGGSGGGAGAAGQDANNFEGNVGGAGLDYSSVFGTGVGDAGAFAGGGCGGGFGSTERSLGGGGGSVSPVGQDAIASTGSGGGGGAFDQLAGDGASGVIVLRYAEPTIALEINETNIIRGSEPVTIPDLMPGLSDTFGGRRNFYPIDEAAADSGTTIEERSLLSAEYRYISRSQAGELDEFYSWAHDRCIVDTSIQDETALNAARDYLVSKVANRRRYFVEVSAFVDADQVIEPGDFVFLQYDGEGLEAGKVHTVVEVRRRYRGTRVDFVLWR